MRLKKGFWHLGLACLSLGCVLATVKSEKDAEVDQLQTQQDFNNPKVRGGCPLSGQFRSKDTRCWVRSVPPSSPQNAGENSYCRVVSGPKPGLYSCKQGTWIPAVPNIEKPSNRGKRGWWWWGRSRQPKPTKPPNKPPYFNYCPNDIQEIARPNENDAVATFTVQADDKEGKATLTLNQGKKSGSRFPEGMTYVRYTATDSQGLTASCSFWVTVKVRRCPRVAELAKFPHGSQRCSGTEKDIYGSHCRHTCLPGYTLSGSALVTCLISRTWTSDFPSCKAVSCGNPGQVAHGYMVCPEGHSYQQLCIVHCHKGYENVGARFPTCGKDGQWIPQYSHCRAQKKRNAVEQGEESVVREETPLGCPPGHYLPPSGSQCLECPQGHYTEEDQATSCTPCPPGWTTPSPASTHSSQCKP